MAFTTPVPELIERNANGLLGKHTSWGRVRLGDVATVKNGAAFKSSHFNTEGRGFPLVRIRDVKRGETATWYDGPYTDDYIVQPGDLIIGMDGDFNHALWSGPPALLNQRVCRLDFRTDALQRDFVAHCIGGYLEAVNAATPSITVKHLSSKTVAELLLPHPSKSEQQLIVAMLDRLLGSLEDGVAHFERALTDLDVLRSACLAEAFSGPTVPLEDVAVIQSGVAKGRADETQVYEMPYLRTANVQALHLNLDDVKTIRVSERQRSRHLLRVDDVLILEGGDADKVGRGWIWAGEIDDCLHQNHVFAVRANRERLLPSLLAYYINAPQARKYFLSVAKQVVNLASINKTNLRALPVPAMTVAEQSRTVASLTSRLGGAESIRRNLEARIADATRLRHTILGATFSGELVAASERATRIGLDAQSETAALQS